MFTQQDHPSQMLSILERDIGMGGAELCPQLKYFTTGGKRLPSSKGKKLQRRRFSLLLAPLFWLRTSMRR